MPSNPNLSRYRKHANHWWWAYALGFAALIVGVIAVGRDVPGAMLKADDVREALRNPTDEQVEPAARALFDHDGIADTGAEWQYQRPYYMQMVRVAWAAAAGGDDE